MKKHDEGYALPFVLVVFVVFSLIATSILTISLNNLKKQQASIQRTQDQYAAQGEIEKVVAQIEKQLKNNTVVENDVSGFCSANVALSEWKGATFKLTATVKTVQIACTLKIEGKNISYESYEVITNGGGG